MLAQAVKEVYAPFSSHVHDPTFLVCWETEKGYDMIGVANLWFNLAGSKGDEPKTSGYGGKDWDGANPSAFKFSYMKGGKDGFQLERTEIYSGPSAVLDTMLKRGILKWGHE